MAEHTEDIEQTIKDLLDFRIEEFKEFLKQYQCFKLSRVFTKFKNIQNLAKGYNAVNYTNNELSKFLEDNTIKVLEKHYTNSDDFILIALNHKLKQARDRLNKEQYGSIN